MDEKKQPPLLFSDKVIHKFVDNLLGRSIDGKQIGVLRVLFRNCGGEWSHIVSGDPLHIGLLIRLVESWGKSNPEKTNA